MAETTNTPLLETALKRKNPDLKMRPILLKGHQKAITILKFNREGDLIFTAAKDSTPCVWYTHNGERIGTYKGHSGSVYALSVTSDSGMLLTGSADSTAKFWEVRTGRLISSITHRAPLKCVQFSSDDQRFLTVTTNAMRNPPTILLYKLERSQPKNSDVYGEITMGKNITDAAWGANDDTIVSTNQDRCIYVHDAETGEPLRQLKGHTQPVNCLSFSSDFVFFVTGSDDRTVKLWDSHTFEVVKTYEFRHPVNAAAIAPTTDHVLIGGGEKAIGAAKSAGGVDQFQAKFFHLIFEDELGSVRGHFGPINTLGFSPDGKCYASGSEDGFVRVHHLPKDYFETQLDITNADDVEI